MKYVIKRGDTLGLIAAEYLGSSARYTEIVKANPQIVNPNIIDVGMEITIPNATSNISAPRIPYVSPATTRDFPPSGSFMDNVSAQFKTLFSDKKMLAIVGGGAALLIVTLLLITKKNKSKVTS